ncbi:hypothetical protein C666_13285 [Thauera linaloolentis 47Lol = DSM 12138]|uniref:Transmembrane protein n=1 Tax=Thauera linaloolentis (strain DSM 12138 / JCM 21573 / CCUG 41526 / CIP 105981 / IAM 15112 / NBRC 102519 / 47Lol) TaxID=1123367 RepID=N6Z2Q1_THAL4|nr:hypothetical protein C666_13285 [Thauera linaloolentis 47Lol = DSM 12138]
MLLALVCILPVAASYLMFYVWQPQGRVNNGTLFEPVPLPDTVLAGIGDQPALGRGGLQGHWTLLLAAPSICDSACARALYVSRQARIAQAREMERVARVWLVTDAGKPAAGQLPGPSAADALHVVRADAAWLAALPQPASGSLAGAVYLVDPLGNVMMRFDDRLDVTEAARALTKDLQRLLKYSALGRGGRP